MTPLRPGILAVVALLFAQSVAVCQTNIWTGSAGNNWQDASNWSLGVTPVSTHTVRFDATTFNLNTVLGSSFGIQGLEVVNTPTNVSIAPVVASVLAPGTGGINITGGVQTLDISTTVLLQGSQSWRNSGGVAFVTVSGNVNLGSNTLTVSNAGVTTLSGLIVGSGGIIKDGASGTLVLSNANGYTGPTVVNAGQLNVTNTTVSATGSGAVTINTGAILAGNGTITGAVTLNGGATISPFNGGNPNGTMTVGNGSALAGNYAFGLTTAGSPAAADSGSSSPGLPHTNHDVIRINGSANLTGLIVNMTGSAGSGFVNAEGYSWRIATATGTITGTPSVGTVAGGDFDSLAGGTFSITSTASDVFLNFTPVPEPALAFGLSAGCLGVACWRKRRGRYAV